MGLLLSAATSAQAFDVPRFEAMWVFGDSLSDNGNFWESCGAGFEPPTAQGYLGGRYSNGIVWAEHLADRLGIDSTDPESFHNLAYGGAYTNDGNLAVADPSPCPGLLGQIFEEEVAPGPRDLVTVWAGANDYFAWVQAIGGNLPASPGACFDELGLPLGEAQQCVEQVVGNIVTAISGLHAQGARQLLVVNLPDLGDTPGGSVASEAFNGLAQGHNLALEIGLDGLASVLDGIRITKLDVQAGFGEFLERPQVYARQKYRGRAPSLR